MQYLHGEKKKVVHLSPSARHKGRYVTTPPSLFLSCSLSFSTVEENEWNFSLKHTHTHTQRREGERTPWLHHCTGKEHPKQAHPNLTSPHTCMYTHTYTSKHIHKLPARKHTGRRAHKHVALQIVFSQPFIWQHARWLECFIFPCVWNWAAVQADTQREREIHTVRDRGRERERKKEGEREREKWEWWGRGRVGRCGGVGCTERMRAAEREGERRSGRKTRREVPRPVTTSSL